MCTHFTLSPFYFRLLSLSSSCSQLSTVPQSIADSPREGPSGAAVLPESSSSLRPRGGVSGRAGERPRESSGWMEAAAEELLSAEEGNSSQILPLSVSLFRAAGSFLLLSTSDLAGQSARFFSCFISPPSDNGRSLLPQKDSGVRFEPLLPSFRVATRCCCSAAASDPGMRRGGIG